MNASRKLTYLFGAALAVTVLFCVWMYFTTDRDVPIGISNVEVLETDLRQEGSTRQKTAVLPADFETARSLLFKSTHEMVEVFVDDKSVYTFGMGKNRFGRSPGTYWHVVDIPAGSAGKMLTVQTTTVYDDFYGSQIPIRFGSHAGCILQLISSIWPIIIINCFIIFSGVISLFLNASTRHRKDKKEPGSFLCIGLFAITIAVWSLRQCGFLQFFIPHARVLYFVDMLFFILFPVPLNLFIYTIFRSKYKKGFLLLVSAYLTVMAAETALQLSGIVDIFQMLRVVHVLMACNALYVFFAVHRERRLEKDSFASSFRIPLYVLMLFGLMEMLSYYVRLSDDISVFLPTGTVIFIVMLIWQQVKEHYRNVMEEQRMLYYEKLANTDMLTGASSRNAYETALKALPDGGENLQGQCVVLFDMNGMKVINDSMGHEKGDEALISCYRCIREVFGEIGQCYRIGGDEFVLLSKDPDGLTLATGRFDDVIGREAQRLGLPFSVAYGYAVYSRDLDESFQDTIRRSDKLMYEDKKRKKMR